MAERWWIIAHFESEAELLDAAFQLRQAGHPAADAYTPYPVHGLAELLGLERSRLGFITFAAGAAGALGAFLLQAWTSAVDWPVNVGGKPALSTLAFIPITFEATILAAGLATAAAFVWRSRLKPRLSSPIIAAGVTDDRFALIVAPTGGAPEAPDLEQLLRDAGARRVHQQRLAR